MSRVEGGTELQLGYDTEGRLANITNEAGNVYAFGNAPYLGNAHAFPVTHIEPTPSRRGYWIIDVSSSVFAFGDAPRLLKADRLVPGETVIGISSTPTGSGYWMDRYYGCLDGYY